MLASSVGWVLICNSGIKTGTETTCMGCLKVLTVGMSAVERAEIASTMLNGEFGTRSPSIQARETTTPNRKFVAPAMDNMFGLVLQDPVRALSQPTHTRKLRKKSKALRMTQHTETGNGSMIHHVCGIAALPGINRTPSQSMGHVAIFFFFIFFLPRNLEQIHRQPRVWGRNRASCRHQPWRRRQGGQGRGGCSPTRCRTS